MAVVLENVASSAAGSVSETWSLEGTESANVFVDKDGVEWDLSYVARFEALRASLNGSLICAWDDEYDSSRVLWTGTTQCWPAAMAICLEETDVQLCLSFAELYDLPLALKPKGYSPAEPVICSGTILIDYKKSQATSE